MHDQRRSGNEIEHIGKPGFCSTAPDQNRRQAENDPTVAGHSSLGELQDLAGVL
ncbi:hypothetical protein D3C83_263700 [compost metagenome]